MLQSSQELEPPTNPVRFKALIEDARVSADRLSRLLGDEQTLLKRIALDSLAVALDEIADRPDETQLTELQTSIVHLAEETLRDESFLESQYGVEYASFLRACLSRRSAVDDSLVARIVEMGPPTIRDERRARFACEGDSPEQLEARIQQFKKRWQLRLLAQLDTSTLPGLLAELKARLDAEFGPVEADEITMRGASFVGPTSPMDADSLRDMSDEDLLKHLASWHPEPNKWMGPSHEGHGRTLTEAISKQPGRLSDRLEEIKELRPTYIRAIVRAWKLAVEARSPISWDHLLSLCEWASQLDDNAKLATEGDDFDDDPDYRSLKFEALQLLEAGLGVHPTPANPGLGDHHAARVKEILTRYAEHPEPSPKYEKEYGGSNMDPMTLSLNTVRPVAIRSLILLVHRFPRGPVASQALETLDQHVGGRDTSLAVTAAVGEGTGRLYDSAPDWLTPRVGLIFGNALPTTEHQQVALSTVLAVYRVHRGLIDLLRGPLTLMIKEMPNVDLAAGWRSHNRTFPQLIGDWLVTAIVTGSMDRDDPLVETWFGTAGAKLRGEVIGHLAWQMMKSEYVHPDVLQRVAELWDWRIAHVKNHPEDAAELSNIYWLARSNKYDVSWWLPRLEYASSVVPGFETHGMISESLADAAKIDPSTALRVCENVLRDIQSSRSLQEYRLIEHAVPQVLASALDDNDPELNRRAVDLMNKLGDAGNISLKDRVESLRHPEE
jgi:hypothetical protein